MAVELGGAQTLGLDTGPAIAALDAYGKKADLTAATIVKNQETVNTSFAEAARQATAYSDSLARQQMEVRNAAAATQSAREALRQLTQQQRDYIAAQSKLKDGSAEYQRLQRLLDQNKQKIAEAKQAINENKAATDQERAAVEKLRDARRQTTNATREEAAAARDSAAAAKQSSTATEGTSQSSMTLGGVLQKVRQAFFAVFAVEKVAEVAGKIREVTAEFQKYEITLTGAFDGDQARAQRALVQVQNFADANGIEIASLTDTYVKLVNRGIIPTTTQLRQLSDIAATSGKSTDQFVEALLDAQTGEFERLKEFGIKVKNNGDTITFSFRGVKQEVKNTQQAISEYLFALGDQSGVQGQAAAQLKSLGGAANDSSNALTELYKVLGDRAKGAFSGFSGIVAGAARGLANFFKTTDKAAFEQSAGGIDRYQQFITASFTQVAAQAKASGQDVGQAIEQAAADQEKFAQIRLARAQAALDAYNKKTIANSEGVEFDTRDIQEETRLKAAVDLAKGQLDVLGKASKSVADNATAEADAVGRIAALRLKIAAEEKARDAAPDTNAGNKERVRLVGQLVADNKLLNELLGKQDKAQQAINNKLAAALRALEQERATLTGLAAKAAEKAADDEATRARLTFQEQLRQTEVLKQKLIEREVAVRKAGGRGANADGVIDGAQEKALTQLRLSALDDYYTQLYKITAAREQRLFDLRANDDQKEAEAIDRKYDALIKRTTDNIERQAIEEARARDQLALKAQQEQRRIEGTATLGRANAATIGDTFGEGTGISVIEAKRAEQQALIDIEKKAAEDSLNNTLNRTGKEAEIERAALRAQLARLHQQQVELDKVKSQTPAEDIFYKAIFGEQDSDENRQKLKQIVGEFASAYEATTRAAVQAADQKIAAYDRDIAELSNSLAAQVQLNQAGSASNIKGIIDQINEEKQARADALREKKEAQRQEALINEAQQASALLTAAANLILGWSELPLVGQVLGALSVAAMLATFLSTRATVASATAGSFFVGGYTGDGDERQTSTAVGPRPYEYHRREFVMPHDLTDKYRYPLFEPLHKGKPIDWSAPELQALLPDLGLPSQMQADKRAYVEHNMRISMEPMKAELAGVKAELAEIKATNQQMADEDKHLNLGDGRIARVTKNGSLFITNT